TLICIGILAAACTSTTFNEGEASVGNPKARTVAMREPTRVFDANFDPSPSSERTDVNPHDHGAEAAAAYTCPMHPEIVRSEPGSCPICGMKLVPKAPSPKHEGTH
ncbi:MAG TPA: heavy metal-binding domain-containing protein, partial [Polyangiaceae bacterium]|nr:heavy metal-binding domain-containing protein [Polyangiaceae bacterium]